MLFQCLEVHSAWIIQGLNFRYWFLFTYWYIYQHADVRVLVLVTPIRYQQADWTCEDKEGTSFLYNSYWVSSTTISKGQALKSIGACNTNDSYKSVLPIDACRLTKNSHLSRGGEKH